MLAGGAKQSAPGMGARSRFLKTPPLVDSVLKSLAVLYRTLFSSPSNEAQESPFSNPAPQSKRPFQVIIEVGVQKCPVEKSGGSLCSDGEELSASPRQKIMG